MPAVRISGLVKVGKKNLLGVGSIIIQQMTIGDNVTLGAGSVLMTKAKKEGRRVGVYPISQNDWKDMGDWNEYLKMIKVL